MEFKIYNGDCLELMKEIPDESVDMILDDLPFNLTDCAWDKGVIDLSAMWEQFKRILKPCCSAVLFASGKFTHKLIASNYDWYKYKWIWIKNAPTMFLHAKNAPMHKFEEILIFSDGVINHPTCTTRRMKYNPQGLIPCEEYHQNGAHNTYGDRPSRPIVRVNDGEKPSQLRAGGRGSKFIHNTDKVSEVSLQGGKLRGNSKTQSQVTAYGGKLCGSKCKFGGIVGERPSHVDYYIPEQTNYPSDVLEFKTVPTTKRFHPTQKPVDLLEFLIKTYTNEGETVLDATMGSGSCGCAAINTNRRFIGFEIETKFYDIAEKRISEAVNEKAQSLFNLEV